MKSSVSVRLSFRFMLIVAAIVLLLSASFVLLLNLSITSRQKKELFETTSLLSETFELQEETALELLGLPYYMTYVIYEAETKYILYTNDLFLPPLSDTAGKVKKHFVKDYFADGNLNLLYCTITVETANFGTVIVEAAIDIDRDSADEMLKGIPRLAIILILPLLLISFLISLLITNRTMKPVKEITRAAEKISSTNLETLLPVSNHNDELDYLAQTFNRLFESLKKDFERERNFTSDVSHELKTPVAGILGQANLLKRWGKNDPIQLEQSLDLIITEASAMNSIITNLLQISKLENGREKLMSENLYTLFLFNRLKNEFLGIEPDLQFSFDETIDIAFTTDIELLHQVLTALISNSIKFAKAANADSPEKGCKIQLSAKVIEDKIQIKEFDNGPGFSEEILPHIFERFYKGDSSHNRKAGGSGLGLSISSSIIRALGGTIYAENRTDETGAVITIELPFSI